MLCHNSVPPTLEYEVLRTRAIELVPPAAHISPGHCET